MPNWAQGLNKYTDKTEHTAWQQYSQSYKKLKERFFQSANTIENDKEELDIG